MTQDRVAASLMALMAQERALLAKGALNDLEPLAARKLTLLGRLDLERLDSGQLDRLRRAALRTEALYDAARAGLAKAGERIETLRRGPPGGVYDARGRLGEIRRPDSQVLRRA